VVGIRLPLLQVAWPARGSSSLSAASAPLLVVAASLSAELWGKLRAATSAA
jgi:hypothetical protein